MDGNNSYALIGQNTSRGIISQSLDKSETFLTMFGSIVLMASSFSCFLLLKFYMKKLNIIIKNILIAITIHNLLTSLLSIFINIIFYEEMTFLICGILFVPVKATWFITFENLALVSFVRYHLAYKTANNENPNKILIIVIAVILYGIQYSRSLVFVLVGRPYSVMSCSKNHSADLDKVTTFFFAIFDITKAVIILVTGMKYLSFLYTKMRQMFMTDTFFQASPMMS